MRRHNMRKLTDIEISMLLSDVEYRQSNFEYKMDFPHIGGALRIRLEDVLGYHPAEGKEYGYVANADETLEGLERLGIA